MGVRVLIMLALVVFAVSGCGFPQAKLDEARGIVEEGLAAWKKGEKPETLKSAARPIDFHDTYWAKGHPLTAYEVKKTEYHDETQTIRCVVHLTVRPPGGRGKESTEEVVYDVKLGPPAIVSTNPMP